MENPFEQQERQDAAVELHLESPLGTSGPAPTRSQVDEKVRENRLRRAAERQGLRLEKSRRRDHRATDFGTYRLVRAVDGEVEAHDGRTGYGLSLDDIERSLTS